VDSALVDRYNYHYADQVFKQHNMAWALEEAYMQDTGEELSEAFGKAGIPCTKLF
jgi:hypothetical protein